MLKIASHLEAESVGLVPPQPPGDVVEVGPGVEGQEAVAGNEVVHLEDELVVAEPLRPDEVEGVLGRLL